MHLDLNNRPSVPLSRFNYSANNRHVVTVVLEEVTLKTEPEIVLEI